MKKIKFITAICAIVLSVFGLSFLPTPTYADDICSHLSPGSEIYKANGCGGSSTTELSDVIVGIVSGIVGVLGIVAAIFVVVGGVNYITSQGDPGKLQKAKNTILYSLIGLIIAVLAFAIVNFVIGGILRENNSSSNSTENSQTTGDN